MRAGSSEQTSELGCNKEDRNMGILNLCVALAVMICWTVCDGKPAQEPTLVKDITITIHQEETSHVKEGGTEVNIKKEQTTPAAPRDCSRYIAAIPTIKLYRNGDCLYQEDMIIDEETCRGIIGSALYECIRAQRHYIKSLGP